LLFIGQVWANHHVMFDHIRAADRLVLLLNALLLMAVAFRPLATSVRLDRRVQCRLLAPDPRRESSART
jgi:uncharacterized membrane protein